MRVAAWGATLLLGCGPAPADFQQRPLVQYWRTGSQLPIGDRAPQAGPPIRCQGQEVYIDGKWVKDGPFTFYDERGNEVASGSYHAGVEQGPWTQAEAGGVLARGAFNGGRREGPWTYTHPNGQTQEEGAYANGKRVGMWRGWRADGSLAAEVNYRAGQRQGECRYYSKAGLVDPSRSGKYVDGSMWPEDP